MSSQPDLIIVGGGSAGCTLAAGLAQRDRRLRITLIDAPGTPAPLADRERPSRWLKLLGSSEDWGFSIEPSKKLADRRLAWPRGRGLGGSSRINAMIWFPPSSEDFSRLAAVSGTASWLPQLQAAYHQTRDLVAPESPRWLSSSSKQFLQAVTNLPGAEPIVYLRSNHEGRRWTSARLLDRYRSSISIVTASVRQVRFDGDRAVGVVMEKENSVTQLRASAGVVLCAGALATPTILMRSGVGCSESLTNHQIDVRIDQPQVGNGLQDHLIMPVVFQVRATSPFHLSPSVRDMARWQLLGTGPVASNIAECGGLFQDGRVQVHVTPTHYLRFPKPSPQPMMTIGVNLTQPLSAGTIRLGGPDTCAAPVIKANYLSNAADLSELVEAVEYVRSIVRETSLSDWIHQEILPGAKRATPASIAKAVARYSQTLYHPVGTCRMGQDKASPVDANFALKGTNRLYVVDASILPGLTTGNPSATVMTLATLAAKVIAGKTR